MVAEIRYRGLKVFVLETLEKLTYCDVIYVSFDIDAMDCNMVSYGTGILVQKGFDLKEVAEIIKQLLESKKALCLEIVEVNPLLDLKGNKMVETAFKVLDDVTQTILNF